MSGHEELSFGGGDPDREPWFEPRLRALRERSAACREWAGARVRALTACAVALAVLGAAGAGGRYLYERSREPLPPPDIAVPAQLRFTVRPCGPERQPWHCPGRKEATEGEIRAVVERMRAMPEVAEARYVSAEEDRRETLAHYADLGEEPLDHVGFQHAIDARLHRSGDFPEVARRLREMPEVHLVDRDPSDFWAGTADLAVVMCGTEEVFRYICAGNRSGGSGRSTTPEEKEAILDRIWELPEAEEVYLQSREHHARLLRHYYPESPSGDRTFRIEPVMETFYVKLSDPAAFPAAARALKSLPGVGWVGRVRSDR
ncbi:permease-like cell division protein FtsX [Planomonospora corallina]|uniref:Permease-like cell division protein FtsX n=1 Tax=Planomonospora corallina TaxID=1806052 RepID=A0ABV8I503_9ACTN